MVENTEDYYVLKNIVSSMRYFTYTHSNKKYAVGCFYGSGDELIKKAYEDSKEKGDFYKKCVDFINLIYDNAE